MSLLIIFILGNKLIDLKNKIKIKKKKKKKIHAKINLNVIIILINFDFFFQVHNSFFINFKNKFG